MGSGKVKPSRQGMFWCAGWILAWTAAWVWLGPDVHAEEEIRDAVGTMQKVGNFGYGIVPDDDPGTRYAPTDEVAAAFQEDGLRVVFSGTVGSHDDGRGGRRWGTPIALTHLEVLPEPAVDGDGSETGSDEPSDPSEG